MWKYSSRWAANYYFRSVISFLPSRLAVFLIHCLISSRWNGPFCCSIILLSQREAPLVRGSAMTHLSITKRPVWHSWEPNRARSRTRQTLPICHTTKVIIFSFNFLSLYLSISATKHPPNSHFSLFLSLFCRLRLPTDSEGEFIRASSIVMKLFLIFND